MVCTRMVPSQGAGGPKTPLFLGIFFRFLDFLSFWDLLQSRPVRLYIRPTFGTFSSQESGYDPCRTNPARTKSQIGIHFPQIPPRLAILCPFCVFCTLRNLDCRAGLCNGTRFIVTKIHSRLLEGVILSGDFKGKRIGIPRITFTPTDTPLPFQIRRRQFPIKPAFVMTIHKAQGQSLRRAGIYLPRPCFSHGQLYVAMSRSGYPPIGGNRGCGVRFVLENIASSNMNNRQGRFEGMDGVYTQNIVYREVFDRLQAQ
jgi:hypothetical protein